ncbi:DUF2264 domain-containing protein [Arcticibacter tournemirensis]|uniref:DUF2264 domain-containing protein n=1 Tax=Arcticibacter tournemirensis TaxID=699437 RepID=A0A4Q0M6L2_9SPHI|nr:DUF2264 domain-containing protein [Arcticibacter tournemirensis]RXF68625.1 DUF2264 domain-containing protein [Arcticibacter tournemirensis]
MLRRSFVKAVPLAGGLTFCKSSLANFINDSIENKGPASDREYWSTLLYKIAHPVLSNLSRNTLKKQMPLEKAPGYSLKAEKVSHLEAFGRTVCGVAPWLALPHDDSAEGKKRKELLRFCQEGMTNAVNPSSPDYLNFRSEAQPLVDAAHLCQGLLRAYDVLWTPLDNTTKQRFLLELKQLRRITPAYNNWVLFAAMVEAFLLKAGDDYEPYRILMGIRKIQEWYKGDGWYADGPDFALDYYNSYVIHSMLADILQVGKDRGLAGKEELELAFKRMQRYSVLLERLISPEGTYPAIGRSMPYRTAAFQPLSHLALLHRLPPELPGPQVRSAVTAVMKRIFEAKGTFDQHGWLKIGICGSQWEVADSYTSTGSLYICTEGFLALGLPPDDPFWSEPGREWTSQLVWSGKPVKNDHASHY